MYIDLPDTLYIEECEGYGYSYGYSYSTLKSPKVILTVVLIALLHGST